MFITIFIVLLGVFCAAMEALVTATIMPTIIAQIGGFSSYPWVTNGFLLASLVTAPFAGACADAFGYRKSYVGAVLLFVIGSFLCGWAASMQEMIIFRIIQGVGSSALLTLSLVLFGALFPVEKRAKMQALIGAMWALASVVGPALGAFLTAKFSWHWAFWINIPVGFVILTLFSFRSIVPEIERKRFKIDLTGGVLFALGTLGIVYGFLSMGKLTLKLQDGLAFFLGGGVLTYFFGFRRGVERPFIPLFLFEKKAISIPTALALFAGFFLFTAAGFTPLFVQGVLGELPAVAGKVVMGVAIGSFTGSMISGLLLNRAGFRWMSSVGLLVVIFGFVTLYFQGTSASIYYLIMGNFFVGMGVSMVANANMVAVQASTPKETLGSATSLLTTARTLGGILGVAMMGGVQLALFYGGLRRLEGTEDFTTGDLGQKIFDPLQRITILPQDLSQIVEVFAHSLNAVFIGCAVFAALAFLLALRLPNVTPKQLSEDNV